MKRPVSGSDVYHWGYRVSVPPLGVERVLEAHLSRRRFHPRHVHEQTQVIWVLSGTMGMESDAGRLRCTPGEACVMPAGLRHGVVWPRETLDRNVTILDLRLSTGRGRKSELTRFVDSLPANRVLSGDVTRWRALARDLREVARQEDTPARTARVASVLWALLADLAGRPEVAPVGGRVGRAEELMNRRLAEPSLDVSDISDHIGLSRSQLTRLFVAQYQFGPAERLRRLRVDHARVLLTTSTLGVKEIARLCGFGHTSHLTRVFKSVTGQTPTEHRDASVV